ncbi:hypothetical protein J6590_097159 [Homalodisca vitripennis]|nr:hypothetical protein J6590_097159 [Homalodisca vitripennis]
MNSGAGLAGVTDVRDRLQPMRKDSGHNISFLSPCDKTERCDTAAELGSTNQIKGDRDLLNKRTGLNNRSRVSSVRCIIVIKCGKYRWIGFWASVKFYEWCSCVWARRFASDESESGPAVHCYCIANYHDSLSLADTEPLTSPIYGGPDVRCYCIAKYHQNSPLADTETLTSSAL